MQLGLALLALVGACCASAALAIDYPGGWRPSNPPQQQCVDICAGGSGRPTCPTADPECLDKAQRPGDFDYLLLEELFLPQFCRELLIGIDPTLEHRNVNKYPAGIACHPERVKSELSIHGLWPNYVAGFPTCCNISAAVHNEPFDPRRFAADHAELVREMGARWVDPTQPFGGFDSLCELYNHEFQKHGLCYAADAESYDQSARIFFEATMRAAASHANATAAINQWAAAESTSTHVTDVKALFPTKVQVLCSASKAAKNQFGSVRSCFQRGADDGDLVAIDCGDSIASDAFVACDPALPLKLSAYLPPPFFSERTEYATSQ